MIKIKFSEFIRVFAPITNKVYENSDYKLTTSYIRLLEKDESPRLLENNGDYRVINSSDEEYPIAFHPQDLNSIVGHSLDRRLWTLYKYEESGITAYKIISGLYTKDDMEQEVTLQGFVVTERPYRELVVVPDLLI